MPLSEYFLCRPLHHQLDARFGSRQQSTAFSIAFLTFYLYSKRVKKVLSKKRSETAYLARLKAIYSQANKILKRHPELDRETMVQTLFLLKKTPTERLTHALMRAKRSHVIR